MKRDPLITCRPRSWTNEVTRRIYSTIGPESNAVPKRDPLDLLGRLSLTNVVMRCDGIVYAGGDHSSSNGAQKEESRGTNLLCGLQDRQKCLELSEEYPVAVIRMQNGVLFNALSARWVETSG